MSETRYTPEQMREWADSPNSSHSTAAMLHQAATDAEQAEYQRRLTASMEELLRSAHCIAARRGEGTHWDRFAASVQALGIGPVTARTYRLLQGEAPQAATDAEALAVKDKEIARLRDLAVRAAGGKCRSVCIHCGAESPVGAAWQWLHDHSATCEANPRRALEVALTAERQKIREIVEARRWHKGAQGVNEEEAGMASRRLLEAIDSLVALTGDATEGQG